MYLLQIKQTQMKHKTAEHGQCLKQEDGGAVVSCWVSLTGGNFIVRHAVAAEIPKKNSLTCRTRVYCT